MSDIKWRHDGRRLILPIVVLPANIHDMRWVDASALVDTGATTSAITGEIAQRLGLRMVGKRPVASAHGDNQVERYIFRIGLFADTNPQDTSPQLPFLYEEIEGFRIRSGFQFSAILGMDILSQCDLSIDRQRRCLLRFGR